MIRVLLIAIFFIGPLTFGIPASEQYQGDDLKIFERLQKTLTGHGEASFSTLSRLGDKTVAIELMVSLDGNAQLSAEILQRPNEYWRWAQPGINDKPQGGSYRLKILSLNHAPSKPENWLQLQMAIHLPFLKMNVERDFEVTTRKDSSQVHTIKATAPLSNDSQLRQADILIKSFSAPDRPQAIWMYVKATISVRSRVLYEALPERLIASETKDRIEQVMRNYQKEENRIKTLLADSFILENRKKSQKSRQTNR